MRHETLVIIFYFNNCTLSFFIPRQVKGKVINNMLWTESIFLIKKPDLTDETMYNFVRRLLKKTPCIFKRTLLQNKSSKSHSRRGLLYSCL